MNFRDPDFKDKLAKAMIEPLRCGGLDYIGGEGLYAHELREILINLGYKLNELRSDPALLREALAKVRSRGNG